MIRVCGIPIVIKPEVPSGFREDSVRLCGLKERKGFKTLLVLSRNHVVRSGPEGKDVSSMAPLSVAQHAFLCHAVQS
ncbi:hypothetical protein COCON_G00189930 [Conger conger]|uniref:Uncharacterized protein n=1 Tax=Conger conger TaxID=82655 RepID=A0A9Q1D3C1_CONCO|nr:hypothetical protein COCON_G00189930 [Conger conger]